MLLIQVIIVIETKLSFQILICNVFASCPIIVVSIIQGVLLLCSRCIEPKLQVPVHRRQSRALRLWL